MQISLFELDCTFYARYIDIKMPKIPFKLKVGESIKVYGKPNSKAEGSVKRKSIEKKEIQIESALSWCREHKKRGYAALATGKFPLIKNRGTIDRRLDGKCKNNKKEHLRVLTLEEESSIVEFIKNKNRCHQGISRRQVTSLIVDVLRIRDHCNSKVGGGRRYVKLNKNARKVLESGRYTQPHNYI